MGTSWKEYKNKKSDSKKNKIKKHLSYEQLRLVECNRNSNYSIYMLYLNEEIVYIGRSVWAFNRLISHWNDKEFNEIQVLYFNNESNMCIIEPYLITKLNPKLNKEFKTNDTPEFNINVDDFICSRITIRTDS